MNPSSIAVVGASERPGPGTRVLQNLVAAKYGGDVYPVNPRYTQLQGFDCYPSLQSLPRHADLVVVTVSADRVPGVLSDAHESGTRAAVVLASGFGEAENYGEDNARAVRQMSSRGMLICGPNCLGIFNVHQGAAAFSGGLSDPPIAGSAALVSQSGGFLNLVADPLMEDRRVGFSYLVSCGNQLGVTVEDYLEYFLEDPETTVAAAYVEGFRSLSRLQAIGARAHELKKPVVVLKVGRSVLARSSARSHTGSIAGSPEILDSMLRRYGILQVGDLDELSEVLCTFSVGKQLASAQGTSAQPVPREFIVITGSGGEGAYVADAADDSGIRLADLTEEAEDTLREAIPEFGAARNPIDGTSVIFRNPDVVEKILAAVVNLPQEPFIAVNLGGRAPKGTYGQMLGIAEALRDAARTHPGRIISYTTSSLGPLDSTLVTTLHGMGVPLILGTKKALKMLRLVNEFNSWKDDNTARADTRTSHVLEGTGILPFRQSCSLLQEYGIQVVPTEYANAPEEAVQHAQRLGYPVALKIDPSLVSHKSDAGCVVLDCKSGQQVREAFKRITENALRLGVDASHGILVQPMITGAAEMLAGVTSDPVMGPAVVLGTGGIFVEVMRDTATEVAPISPDIARRMIGGIRGAALLEGHRGTRPRDVGALITLLVNLSTLASDYRNVIGSIDLNPVMVNDAGGGVSVVDILIQVAEQPHEVSTGSS
jgi:acetyltransferase